MLSKARMVATRRNCQALYRQVQASHLSSKPQSLPRQPVPKLCDTIEKYIKSVEPLLNEAEMKSTKKVLEEFQSECGMGTKLQKMLFERAECSENWLADWWLNVAYLEYRDPVVVYSSPGLMLPCEVLGCDEVRNTYAAKMIFAALDYKEYVESGTMPVEKMGKDPLDMNQYNKIFGTCRLPGLKRDGLEYNPQSKHIAIVKNNNFFKLTVIDEEGRKLGISDLVCSLGQVVKMSEQKGPAIGVLTSDNRDNWGKAYAVLIQDPCNLKSVREIQTSLFLVCLDNPMPNQDEGHLITAAKQLIHGGGCNGNPGNRWYDKTVQFVLGLDGTVGLTYEHSPAEGGPIAVMSDFIIKHIAEDVAQKNPGATFDGNLRQLTFNVDDRIEKAISNSYANVDKLANNLDLNCFKFTCYGKEFIKSQKVSPDSYLQMAMQLAFYRIYNKPAAHYESAACRKYIHGRTETIRSCSVESVCFAKAMLDCKKSDKEKADALRAAIAAHKKYSVEAVNGFGVDRHLVGLKLVALENGLPVPEFYKDVSYTRSTHMRITSSQVAVQCDGLMCYGPTAHDGYACCYNPRKNDINFAISAFVDNPETTANKFKEALTQSLQDMHDVLAKTQVSKL